MSPVDRYLADNIAEDLKEKMVFVGGARQVGKTNLSWMLLEDGSARHPAYLNWDAVADKAKIRKGMLPPAQPLIVFDEIHKYARWRSLIKGLYDKNHPETKFLVTGSARLDHYRKGGDSLQGRYHYYRLHPFSLMELSKQPNKSDLTHLMTFGGFPEPALKGSHKKLRRWQQERLERIIFDDIRTLENIREISLIELLLDSLPERVGSPLSVQSLSEDLEVAHDTVKRWLDIADAMYVSFRISPFGSKKINAVKKEKKLYLWDWSVIKSKGARFENLVACQLLKYCHYLTDSEGHKMELRFLRDVYKREVDFVIIKDGVPVFAVECKHGEKSVSPALRYCQSRTKINKFYQVHGGTTDYIDHSTGIRIMPFCTFCRELSLP